MQLTFKTKKELIETLTSLDDDAWISCQCNPKKLYLSDSKKFLRIDRHYTGESELTQWRCYRAFDSGEIDSPDYRITRYGDGWALKRIKYYIASPNKELRVYCLSQII
jgi:hypothetical protein